MKRKQKSRKKQGSSSAIFQKQKPTWCECRKGKTSLGNFGVFCGLTGRLIDSAVDESEAIRFCEYINERLKQYPLFSPTPKRWLEWVRKYQEWSPEANVMYSDDVERFLETGTGDLRLFSEVMKELNGATS